MDNPKPLNRIKVMLAERMVTNKELAEMLGKDLATVSKWVRMADAETKRDGSQCCQPLDCRA